MTCQIQQHHQWVVEQMSLPLSLEAGGNTDYLRPCVTFLHLCAGHSRTIFHMVSFLPPLTVQICVRSGHWQPHLPPILYDNDTQFLKSIRCTGSPLMGSWGWAKKWICGSFYKWLRETVTSSSSGEQMLDPDTCWLFLWCLGDGRSGLGIVKLPSLTCSTS